MPHYVFDVHDGTQSRNTIGAEMASLKEARREAMQIARAYAGKPEMDDADGGVIVVQVRDATGATALTVRLVFSVEVR